MLYEDFREEHATIEKEEGLFCVYIDGVIIDAYETLVEAKDCIEETISDILTESYDLRCTYCLSYYNECEVQYKLDPETLVPYGDTWVKINKSSLFPVCPICGDELESIK